MLQVHLDQVQLFGSEFSFYIIRKFNRAPTLTFISEAINTEAPDRFHIPGSDLKYGSILLIAANQKRRKQRECKMREIRS